MRTYTIYRLGPGNGFLKLQSGFIRAFLAATCSFAVREDEIVGRHCFLAKLAGKGQQVPGVMYPFTHYHSFRMCLVAIGMGQST